MIHPSVDGNGQTFKCATLSYIQELIPELRDRFIPLKYSEIVRPPEQEITTMFGDSFSDIPVPQIQPETEGDGALLTTVTEIANIERDFNEKVMQNRNSFDRFEYEKNRERLEVVRRLGMPEVLDGIVLREVNKPIRLGRFTLPEKLTFRKYTEKVPEYAGTAFRNRIYQILVEKGYDAAQTYRTIYRGTPPKSARSTYGLMTLLGTEEAREKMKEYVVTGNFDQTDSNKALSGVFEIALQQFKGVEENIFTILVNEDVSSRDAIQNQLAECKMYQPYARFLDTLKQTDLIEHQRIQAEYFDLRLQPMTIQNLVEIIKKKMGK